ncbi:MAG: dipeptidase E [Bacteroidetes bacterium GWE2_41_25]|nr:MAG: dipeptidase E [Bacteroidetes bacterium GWA2_40_15]OFX87919.1 MAG: dipeptidase E [Bacteroidetes bacterium GWC2_40_22]OFY05415.1 MAG: dipeptidase E [Bacteroidetes bacterium GWE2_41_25]OFY59910.1 MAG: dipeptidase E [Bacteroidetes bacterium GWF2_41_9]HAM11281.1 dipeptidase PepE [Bacteroidales bacterium]
MRLLLISNSTNPGEPYLDYPKNNIRDFLGKKPVKALFIPYAAVTFSYETYEEKVNERFREIGHEVVSIHHYADPVAAVREAHAIVVGGGNTWKLLKTIRENNLIDVVREKVLSGTPYIGWSAGSNMACPTIKTTNDMAVVEPDSFNSFNLIPFQINPHYLDANPAGHAGETREQRIEEFIEVNPGIIVAGLREGCMFLLEKKTIKLIGKRKVRVFKKGQLPAELGTEDDLSFLLQ